MAAGVAKMKGPGEPYAPRRMDSRMREGKTHSIYPCLFPVKVIGEHSPEFEAAVLAVMRGYVEDLSEEKIGRRTSGGGKYLSLTVHVVARNLEHLEKMYADLNARKEIIMLL
jgi:putative lipoic acid-binding regulatory protein